MLLTCWSQAGDGSLWTWIESNSALFGWLFVLSIGSLALTALLLPLVVIRLEPDYFLVSRRELAHRRGPWRWVLRIGKNLLGVVFLFAGLAMLFLPGQGLLTIFIGLLLLEFPGKRALERRLVARPAILQFLNRMRARRGHPPLQIDGPGADP